MYEVTKMWASGPYQGEVTLSIPDSFDLFAISDQRPFGLACRWVVSNAAPGAKFVCRETNLEGRAGGFVVVGYPPFQLRFDGLTYEPSALRTPIESELITKQFLAAMKL